MRRRARVPARPTEPERTEEPSAPTAFSGPDALLQTPHQCNSQPPYGALPSQAPSWGGTYSCGRRRSSASCRRPLFTQSIRSGTTEDQAVCQRGRHTTAWPLTSPGGERALGIGGREILSDAFRKRGIPESDTTFLSTEAAFAMAIHIYYTFVVSFDAEKRSPCFIVRVSLDFPRWTAYHQSEYTGTHPSD